MTPFACWFRASRRLQADPMPAIAHVSDLHFGAADCNIVAALVATINRLAPDAVAVSGDLTQRARLWQFREARSFLERLPTPQIVVPGNHDIPLYNLIDRFGSPLRQFRRHITANLNPYFYDGTIALIGANTTRSFTVKDGGFRRRDVARIATQVASLDPAIVKIVVCHHPFDPPTGRVGRWTMPRPDSEAMATLAASGVDIFLTGHLHVGYTGEAAVRYKACGRAAIVVEAGTAASTRVRGEANSFNVLRIERNRISVERLEWNGETGGFGVNHAVQFRRTGDGWITDTVTA
jgi:3',5'-cyclic AMP phosphodiesterase CpdA